MNATFKIAIHRDGVSIQYGRCRCSNAKCQNPWNLSFVFAFGLLFDSDVRIAVKFANNNNNLSQPTHFYRRPALDARSNESIGGIAWVRVCVQST